MKTNTGLKKPSNKSTKDTMIGKTIRITKGGFKGLLGQIVSSTNTHFSIELLAKVKKIVIEREKTVEVGDKNGVYKKEGDGDDGNLNINADYSMSTPFLVAATPSFGFGNQTPGYSGFYYYYYYYYY
jgi:transcription elongation factor